MLEKQRMEKQKEAQAFRDHLIKLNRSPIESKPLAMEMTPEQIRDEDARQAALTPPHRTPTSLQDRTAWTKETEAAAKVEEEKAKAATNQIATTSQANQTVQSNQTANTAQSNQKLNVRELLDGEDASVAKLLASRKDAFPQLNNKKKLKIERQD